MLVRGGVPMTKIHLRTAAIATALVLSSIVWQFRVSAGRNP